MTAPSYKSEIQLKTSLGFLVTTSPMKVLPVFLVQCVRGCHQWYSEMSLKISKQDHDKQETAESRSRGFSSSRYEAKLMERSSEREPGKTSLCPRLCSALLIPNVSCSSPKMFFPKSADHTLLAYMIAIPYPVSKMQDTTV